MPIMHYGAITELLIRNFTRHGYTSGLCPVQFILCINTYVSLIMHLFAMIPASIIGITNKVGICMLALKLIML
jgi:hypothetical protein